MNIVLIAGLWLDGSAWDDVAAELRAQGHRPVPVTLPGQGDGSPSATLEDQVHAVLAAVDDASGDGDGDGDSVIVVGHSAASSLAWIAADARPDTIAAAVMIGGFPASDGDAYADFFEPVDGVMAFPGWAPFEGPDSDDLDEAARHDFVEASIPVPEGVSRGIVRLADERRFSVPVVLICPEYSPADAKAWLEAGEIPELAKAERVEFVDIDSGHWPMLTRPAELAHLLAAAARA